VGQHGNYGVSRNHLEPSIEEVTSDKFLTWGWSDGLAQHTPLFNLKVVGRKSKCYNKNGGLALIELCHPHRVETWDVTDAFANYFNDQIQFVNGLAPGPRKKLIVRLHAGYRMANWSEPSRWLEFNPNVHIDHGLTPIRNLVRRSRLVVHSYDSTGILETLSQNVPTLSFWQNGFDHLRDSAKPYYQMLVEAGIVHLTADSIANQVNVIWDDVEGWWMQSTVQEARREFCAKYSRKSLCPINDLKRVILS
jgi:putative transferase (TIGR04331 family)